VSDENFVNEAIAHLMPSLHPDVSDKFLLKYKGEPLAVVVPFGEYVRLAGIASKEQLRAELERREHEALVNNKQIVVWAEEALTGGYFAQTADCSIVVEAGTYDELKRTVLDVVRRRFDEKDRPASVRFDVMRHEILSV
jgi:hypothetical protein